jgi:hypothetical protein
LRLILDGVLANLLSAQATRALGETMMMVKSSFDGA